MPLPVSSLAAEGLTKRFGRRVLFRDLALSIQGGEALAITGPNGSGKSTLLMILAGLTSATAGKIAFHLDGHHVADDERPLRTGLVAPYMQFYEDFSARENLRFIASARRLRDGDRDIARLLELVGLAGREDDPLKIYSSGMKQRARFAAAMLPRPAVLLLDEPGSNLDAAGRQLVADIVANHTADGGAAVVATNADDEAGLCRQRVELGRSQAVQRSVGSQHPADW